MPSCGARRQVSCEVAASSIGGVRSFIMLILNVPIGVFHLGRCTVSLARYRPRIDQRFWNLSHCVFSTRIGVERRAVFSGSADATIRKWEVPAEGGVGRGKEIGRLTGHSTGEI
jgi:hypothetical protein